MAKWLVDAWYKGSPWLSLLTPLEALTKKIVCKRREKFLAESQKLWQAPVPVIVVGNITVGGTGKTPLVAKIVKLLQNAGFTPGIISRGYGAKTKHLPKQVSAESDPFYYGDEPVLLASETKVPLVIDPNRSRAAKFLLQQYKLCDVIISDDGLQHYRLARDIEIAVVDGARLFGNGHLLPKGPLREPVQRLQSVDFVIVNGQAQIDRWSSTLMHLQVGPLCNIATGSKIQTTPQALQSIIVHVVAGIGNPQRVFSTVEGLGFEVIPHSFADHYSFKSSDLDFQDQYPVIMTTKDAIKCRQFATNRCWALQVEAMLPEAWQINLLSKLNTVIKVRNRSG